MRLACLFLCTFPIIVFSQNADSLRAAVLLENAIRQLEAGQLDSSRMSQKSAADAFLKNDNLVGWLKVADKTADAWHSKKGDPVQAIQTLKTAFATLPRQPKSAPEWNKLAWSNVQAGYLGYYETGDLSLACRHYEQAKKIFEEKLNPDDPDVADYVYRELGNLYTRLGDYEAAEILLQKFKNISIRHGQFSNAADACADLARIFGDLGKPEQAAAICKEGLQLPQLPAASKAILQANLAEIFLEKKEYEQALRYGELALQTVQGVIERGEHPRAKAWLSHIQAIVGQAGAALQRYPEAEAQLLKALKTATEFYAPDLERREIAKLESALGNLYLLRKMPRQALPWFHRSLQSVLPALQDTAATALPSAASIYAENSIKEALLGKALAFEQLFVSDQKPQYLQAALRCRALAFSVDEQLRRSYQFELSKLKIIEESQQESEQVIEMALKMNGQSGAAAMRDSAFLFAEINKSVLLFEALRQSGAGSLANVPDSLLQQTGALESEIAELEKSVFKLKKQTDAAASAEQISSAEEAILKKRKSRKDLVQQIEEDFPAFHQVSYEKDIASVAEVQKLLRPKQALIEYFVGDSTIFIFLIKKDAFHVERVVKNFPLEAWVAQFRQDIEAFQFSTSNRDSLCQTYTDLGQKLYQKLLQPLEKQGLSQDLTIVPGGILGFLPFDALLYEAPPAPCAFKRYPYLVLRHNISYNYSSTLMRELLKPKRKKASAGFAGFAPEFLADNTSGFGPLQFNIAGVEEIARLFGGKALLRSDATGKNFLEIAGEHGIICLSTHAKANTDEGDFSFIILAKQGGGFDTLFVKDIYNLPLSADLVFLGACETGSGKFYNGEGIISLARSFLYAGARSIVTTLWSINDESNKKLTISFFRHLHDGKRKDEALRLAKQEQLKSSDFDLFAHPVYWAAYTPIGNMEPVESRFAWWWLAAGIGVAGIVFLAKKQLKKRREFQMATT